MNFQITDAERKAAPVTAAFIGQSGSGKTYSALLLARGLVGPSGRIGVIDTEGRRSLIYADDPKIGGFRHLDMRAPYSPEACMEAFDAAVADGWQAVIFDSASLEHDGPGGLLEMADEEATRLEEEADKKGRENRAIKTQMWTKPKLRHRRFLNHAVGLPCHVIMTFREVLTTDFKANPPATVLTEVIEKNTKFALDLHCYFDREHKATWARVPEPFRPYIQQGAIVTVEMGAAIAGQATPKPVAETSAPATADINDVLAWLSDEWITDEQIAAVFAALRKPLPADWKTGLTAKQCEWILSPKGMSTIKETLAKL